MLFIYINMYSLFFDLIQKGLTHKFESIHTYSILGILFIFTAILFFIFAIFFFVVLIEPYYWLNVKLKTHIKEKNLLRKKQRTQYLPYYLLDKKKFLNIKVITWKKIGFFFFLFIGLFFFFLGVFFKEFSFSVPAMKSSFFFTNWVFSYLHLSSFFLNIPVFYLYCFIIFLDYLLIWFIFFLEFWIFLWYSKNHPEYIKKESFFFFLVFIFCSIYSLFLLIPLHWLGIF